MKKPPTGPFLNRLSLLTMCLIIQVTVTAQLQWYQNQDGNLQPNGTYGTAIQPFGSNSFVACYLWTIDNDQFTWKISRTSTNGDEMRTFFVTGTTTIAEIKVGHFNTVYVLTRSFPFGQNPEYTVYKLNSSLEILTQKSFSFPNGFNIFNLNAFELDDEDNVYLAGDGQYPDGPGFLPASFVLKTNKNLVTKWSRMDSVETSYSKLHIQDNGTVVLLEDYYTTYPDIRVTKISYNGQSVQRSIVQTDANRLSLFSTLDKNGNLLLYGSKSTEQGLQAIYLRKLSKYNWNVIYHKTHFTSSGTDLYDLKLDKNGNIFTLFIKYGGSSDQLCGISRINPSNGTVQWHRYIPFSEDSCILTKLVVNQHERFYAIGERRGQTYYSKGFAMRFRKNGVMEGNFPSPDSISFQRSHVLLDGIIDNDDRLIAIGNTNDFDTLTYSSSYFRAFAARFGNKNGGCDEEGKNTETITSAARNPMEMEASSAKVTLFPNPAQNELILSNLEQEGYDQVRIYNAQGVSVMQRSISGNTARMDVSNLAKGMYFVFLRSSATRKEKSLKFVVER